ncbi:hypothetical protein EXT48_16935 [Pseudoalteromonas sp. CO348]|uniref:hypothetical protein n=1 Tax=unclassified Pseudoalteromonas TaxID=194690 RepID=UPI0010233662|nr:MULTISPECIES: hypothetical protein [unclassified Pseudoalteromonas]MCG7541067.1 hypothetical protein [Pseudoalteromonas sp. OF7H-1]RZG01012.1 hypothetical protein EXT48_16935 [Pseudoalteromonas sp. CO348]
MKTFLIVIFFLTSFDSLANSSFDLSGSWEGFYSGSHIHQGKMTIEVASKSCSVTMQRLDKSEVLQFPCEKITHTKGVYHFTAKQKFTSGAGYIEWVFSFALGIGHDDPKVTRKLIGTWLQGMKEKEAGNLIGLNSGSMKLKELKNNKF